MSRKDGLGAARKLSPIHPHVFTPAACNATEPCNTHNQTSLKVSRRAMQHEPRTIHSFEFYRPQTEHRPGPVFSLFLARSEIEYPKYHKYHKYHKILLVVPCH